MRVLTVGNMYPPHSHGGYELLWRSAVRHLRASGHEVRVLTTDFRDPLAAGEAEDADVHRELRWFWRDHVFADPSLEETVELERHNAAVLDRHVEEFRPDVVSWWAMGGLSMGMIERVRRAGTRSVGVVIDDWIEYGPEVDPWSRRYSGHRVRSRAAERRHHLPVLHDFRGTEWIFVSEVTREAAVRNGLPLGPTQVLPHGIDLEAFAPAPEREWGWRLLCLGRLDERKGTDIAIEALAHLPKATLRVVGRGDPAYGESLRELAGRLGVLDRVEFAQVPHEQVPAEYAEADAVLFPVRWREPQGLVPLEAMAVGRPVIARAAGGAAAFLRHAENCLVLGPEDEAAEAAALVQRLAADDALRARLRAGGLETVAGFSEVDTHRALEEAITGG